MKFAGIVGSHVGKTEQITRSARVHAKVGIENRGDENGTPVVRFRYHLNVAFVWPHSDCRPKGFARSERFTELECKVNKRIGFNRTATRLNAILIAGEFWRESASMQSPSGALNGFQQRLGKCEVLQQGNHIG